MAGLLPKACLIFYLTGVVGGCQPEQGAAPAPVKVRAEIEPVPRPDLHGLEAAVRGHLHSARADLEDALTTGEADPALSHRFGELGKLYHAHGFREAAGACYRNAEQLAPQRFHWPYYLGHVYRSEGDVQRSLQSFQRAAALNPSYLPAYVALAQLHLQENRLEKAEELLARGLALDPEAASIFLELGRLAYARQNPREAVRLLEKALRLAPSASEIHYPLGMAYRDLGDLEKARYFLERRGTVAAADDALMRELEELTVSSKLHLVRGHAAFKQGLYGEALEHFRDAVESDPSNILARVNLGTVFARLGKDEDAEAQFRAALAEDAGHELANLNMAMFLAGKGQDEAALFFYDKALEVNPDMIDAHFNAANAFGRLGRYAEAEEHYRRVLELDPGNPRARYSWARTLMHLERWKEARDSLERSHELFPDQPLFANALARMLAACPVDALRDGERSLAIARALVERSASTANLEVLAMALAEVGRYQEASRYQEAAMEAARTAGRADAVAQLQSNLSQYRSGKPARTPFPDFTR